MFEGKLNKYITSDVSNQCIFVLKRVWRRIRLLTNELPTGRKENLESQHHIINHRGLIFFYSRELGDTYIMSDFLRGSRISDVFEALQTL